MRGGWWAAAAVVTIATTAWADPAFERINLVSNNGVKHTRVDPNLKNAWGLAASPTGPWWSANNGTGTATLYDANGTPQPQPDPLVVMVPGAPTGEVFYGGNAFTVVDSDGNTGPARFIFASEDGTISAWSPNVPPQPPGKLSTQAFVMFSGGDAIFKGLAVFTDCHGDSRLYATDFHNGRVVVVDDTWNEVPLGKHRFVDKRLPDGYAPFGIAIFHERVFVTYALQDEDKEDDVKGLGHGFIDEYDLEGRFIRRVASRGLLNSPWGLAIGPESFGRFDDALLVGNFGDGRIHAFKRGWWGEFFFAGTLRNEHGKPIAIDGLWSIVPGNGGAAGSPNDLYFTSGPNDEDNGLFGFIRRAHW